MTQWSVLGPILFFVYINDLPENVTYQVRLFAADAAMYLAMEGANDSSVFQQELDRLSVWESDWDMEFNPSKCQVVQVTCSIKLIKAAYRLHGVILETVTCARYLGLIFPATCRGAHTQTGITGTANITLGFVKEKLPISPWSGHSWNIMQPFGIPAILTKPTSLRKPNGELHVGRLAALEEWPVFRT